MIGKTVIIRTYSAGVHFGVLQSQSADGKLVTLSEAKRIWSWKGALSISDIAAKGCKSDSKISNPAPSIQLTEAIEVIECTPIASEIIRGITWTE